MSKFSFRLEKVLEVRRHTEKEAKDLYLEARARRLDCENDIDGVGRVREQALKQSLVGVNERLSFEQYLIRLTDEARALHSNLSLLMAEEEQAKQAWIDARQSAEAVQKLRDKAYAEHLAEQERLEQAALDEWATMRRVA